MKRKQRNVIRVEVNIPKIYIDFLRSIGILQTKAKEVITTIATDAGK